MKKSNIIERLKCGSIKYYNKWNDNLIGGDLNIYIRVKNKEYDRVHGDMILKKKWRRKIHIRFYDSTWTYNR